MPGSLYLQGGAISGMVTYSTSQNFSGSASITAAISSEKLSATLTTQATTVTALTCQTDGPAGKCAVAISIPAPPGGATMRLDASSSLVRIPASVNAPEGETAVSFPIEVLPSGDDQVATVRVTLADRAVEQAIAIRGARPARLTCREHSVQAGESVICEAELSAAVANSSVEFGVSTNSTELTAPTVVRARSGHTRALFEVTADPFARQHNAEVTVRVGSHTVHQSLLVVAGRSPAIQAPVSATATLGRAVRFPVLAQDATGLPVQVTAADLPPGASFDSAARLFEWTPAEGQAGTHTVKFQAANSAGATSSVTVAIDVGPNAPMLSGIASPVTGLSGDGCVAGSRTRLQGKWLSEVNRVRVNGEEATMVSRSAHAVEFLCPFGEPGAALEIAVESPSGRSNIIHATRQEAAPEVVLQDSRRRALMQFAEDGGAAGIPSATFAGEVAIPGDTVAVWITGVSCARTIRPSDLWVEIAGVRIAPESVAPDAERIDCRVNLRLPENLAAADDLPLLVRFVSNNGQVYSSKSASLALGR